MLIYIGEKVILIDKLCSLNIFMFLLYIFGIILFYVDIK